MKAARHCPRGGDKGEAGGVDSGGTGGWEETRSARQGGGCEGEGGGREGTE